jgi:hypothetical protein
VADDDAGAEKADAGGDCAQRRAGVCAAERQGDLGKDTGRTGDQGTRAQAAGVAPPFALCADRGT